MMSLATIGLQLIQTVAILWLCFKYAGTTRRISVLEAEKLFTIERTGAASEHSGLDYIQDRGGYASLLALAGVSPELLVRVEESAGHGWTPERRAKYAATIAAKKRARQEGGLTGQSGE